MEFICKFPSVPESIENFSVISWFGQISSLTDSISNYINEKVLIEPGFNFYKFKHSIFITFTTDNIQPNFEVFGLLKLIDITKNIFVCVSNSIPNIRYDKYPINKKFSLEKLKNFTVSEFQVEKKWFNEIISIKLEGTGKFSQNIFVEMTSRRRKTSAENDFNDKINNFLEVLQLKKLEINESELHEKTWKLNNDLREIGFEDINFEVLLKEIKIKIFESQKSVHENFQKLKEKAVEHILQNFEYIEYKNYKFIYKKYFSDALAEFQQIIITKNELTLDLFIKTSKDLLFGFLKPSMKSLSQLENYLNEIFWQYNQELFMIIEKFKDTFTKFLSTSVGLSCEYALDFNIKELKISKKINWELIGQFQIYQKSQFYLEQVVKCDNSFIFLIKHTENPDYIVYIFNGYTAKKIKDYHEKVQIIEGSTLEKIFIIKFSNLGYKLIECKEQDDIEYVQIPLQMNFPNYLQDLHQIIFVDSDHYVSVFNVVTNCIRRLKIQGKINKMILSEGQKYIIIKFDNEICIFNLRLKQIFKYTSECFHYYLFEQNFLRLVVFTSKNDEYIVKCMQLNVSNEIPKKKQPEYISNYLEIIFESGFIEGRKIYFKFEISHVMNYYNNYFLLLSKIFPLTGLYTAEKLEPGNSCENFYEKIYHNYFIKIAEIKDLNVVPVHDQKNFYEEIAKETENFYQQVHDFIDFGVFENYITKLENVKIISFIGSKKTAQFISTIFGGCLAQSLEKGIWMSYFSYKSSNFICFFSELSKKPIINVKQIALLLYLSDIFVVDSDENLSNLKNLMKFAENRINSQNFVMPRIEIFSVGESPSIISSTFDFKFFVSEFALNSKSLTQEIHHLMRNYLSLPSKWQGKTLMESMKHMLTQLFLDDYFSLDSRLLMKKPEYDLRKELFLSDKNSLSIKSYQIILSKDSKNCKKKCPGCSALCDLENFHEGLHFAKVHRINTNKFVIRGKTKFNIPCDMECLTNREHRHMEPCMNLCEMGASDFRHHIKESIQFDTSDNTFEVDLLSCKNWWDYKGWRLL